jgi:hypothetical protein
LNAAQLEQLRWVSRGCPEGVYDGYTHRISAAALQSRGLLKVSGRGPLWRAELTPRGAAVLDVEPEPVQVAHAPPTKVALRQAARPRTLSKTDQLIADLVAAGGVLRVPYWRREGEPDYRQRALAAQRFGKVPTGKRLVLEHLRGGELEIRLDDALPGSDIDARPVPVPARLTKPHPVAGRYRDDSDYHQVSRALLPRSVRIVHSIAVEAERRGHQAAYPKRAAREFSARDSAKEPVGHLQVSVGNHTYSLSLSEEKVLLRGVAEERKRQQEQYRRQFPLYSTHERVRSYDADATGQLSIALTGAGGSREGRAISWSDRKTWRLEDKLPELLQELELRSIEDDHRAAEEKRKADERQRQWEAQIAAARERFGEAHRANVLRAQIAARHEAKAMSAYLAELEGAHGASPVSSEWIDWIREFIARIDPLASPPTMPAEPEIGPEDLKPFLPAGVSPYGPQRW